jgi:hypothetical protein
MRYAETYERYAPECERIAKTMTGEHRKSLLAIDEAWRCPPSADWGTALLTSAFYRGFF